MKGIKRLLFMICLVTVIFSFISSNIYAATGTDIVNVARNQIGKPYSSSNRLGPNSFDCSGLVWYVCNQLGISMSSGNCNSQMNYGSVVDYGGFKNSFNCSNLQLGDLIFFDYGGDGVPDHVGIYSGNGNMIDALTSSYYGYKVVEHSINVVGNSSVSSTKKFYQYTCAIRRVTSYAHVHNYTGLYYETSHPHREYKMCSCGASQYTGGTGYMTNCSICNPPVSLIKWVNCSRRICIPANSPRVYIYRSPDAKNVYDSTWDRFSTSSSERTFYPKRYAVLSNGTLRYELNNVYNEKYGEYTAYINASDVTLSYTYHTYSSNYQYDTVHPHMKYRTCECGYKSYDSSSTKNDDNCLICNPFITLTYDSNGGQEAPPAQSVRKKEGNIIISGKEPIREGFTFMGWSNDPNAKKASYSSGDKYYFYDNTVLYAIWSVMPNFTVTQYPTYAEVYNDYNKSQSVMVIIGTYEKDILVSIQANEITFKPWEKRKFYYNLVNQKLFIWDNFTNLRSLIKKCEKANPK